MGRVYLDVNALVPSFRFTRTLLVIAADTKDRPILSAASLARADLVITENIKDFGAEDLARLQMSAVHPDLFPANHLSVGGRFAAVVHE